MIAANGLLMLSRLETTIAARKWSDAAIEASGLRQSHPASSGLIFLDN